MNYLNIFNFLSLLYYHCILRSSLCSKRYVVSQLSVLSKSEFVKLQKGVCIPDPHGSLQLWPRVHSKTNPPASHTWSAQKDKSTITTYSFVRLLGWVPEINLQKAAAFVHPSLAQPLHFVAFKPLFNQVTPIKTHSFPLVYTDSLSPCRNLLILSAVCNFLGIAWEETGEVGNSCSSTTRLPRKHKFGESSPCFTKQIFLFIWYSFSHTHQNAIAKFSKDF